jgi:putative ABC transport system permease protein
VAVALIAGIGVTVVAALSPARRAGRVSPIAAMTDSPTSDTAGESPRRALAGTGVLSRQNAMRNPRRTATTASALMVCVGMVGFMTIFASSARASINSVVDQSFTGDYVINSGAGLTGGFDPSLAQRLSRLPQLSAVTGLRLGMALIDGSSVQLAAADPNTAFKLFNVKPLQGSEQALGPTPSRFTRTSQIPSISRSATCSRSGSKTPATA